MSNAIASMEAVERAFNDGAEVVLNGKPFTREQFEALKIKQLREDAEKLETTAVCQLEDGRNLTWIKKGRVFEFMLDDLYVTTEEAQEAMWADPRTVFVFKRADGGPDLMIPKVNPQDRAAAARRSEIAAWNRQVEAKKKAKREARDAPFRMEFDVVTGQSVPN